MNFFIYYVFFEDVSSGLATCLDKLYKNGHQGNENDGQYYHAEIVLYEIQVSEKEACTKKQRDP